MQSAQREHYARAGDAYMWVRDAALFHAPISGGERCGRTISTDGKGHPSRPADPTCPTLDFRYVLDVLTTGMPA